MSCLHYRDKELFVEEVSLTELAEKYGTPLYVYSRAAIETNWRLYDEAFGDMPHQICYSVKANSNIAILNLLARLKSGFDIVSIGELERVLAASGDPKRVVFSGVGKRTNELRYAIEKHISCFNVESEAELINLQHLAANMNKTIKIAFRINPNISPQTHAHIVTGTKANKFGIDIDNILPLCRNMQNFPNLHLVGLACHIGSQITDLAPLLLAADKLIELYKQIKELGIILEYINVGGGLGIAYHKEKLPSITDYVKELKKRFKSIPVKIISEPGRAIVGNAGILLTRVEYLKHTNHKNFAIVDAGMNDFARPALYGAWQDIKSVVVRNMSEKVYDVAGPVCESSDILGKDRSLALMPGDLLAIDATGAYGLSMSSNYNSRPRPSEVIVDGKNTFLIRKRETVKELFASEKILELEKV